MGSTQLAEGSWVDTLNASAGNREQRDAAWAGMKRGRAGTKARRGSCKCSGHKVRTKGGSTGMKPRRKYEETVRDERHAGASWRIRCGGTPLEKWDRGEAVIARVLMLLR